MDATLDRRLDAAADQWRDQGWVVVHDLVPAEDIDRAVEDLWDVYPRPEEFHRDPAVRERFAANPYPGFDFVADSDRGPAFRADQFLGHTMFPYRSLRLNRLNIHPAVVGFARRAMQCDDLRLYQARMWAKYTGVVDYEQPFHQDRNHNVVPDRLEPGWWNMEGFLYLSDVEDDLAPTEVIGIGPTPPDDPPVSAAGRRGSYLAYRPDVWHRGVDLTRPGGSRFLMNAAFKRAGHDWIGYDNVQPVTNRRPWIEFAASCTPDELALFGAPLPGHDYWTSELVERLAARYPGLDVTPWRDALRDHHEHSLDEGPARSQGADH